SSWTATWRCPAAAPTRPASGRECARCAPTTAAGRRVWGGPGGWTHTRRCLAMMAGPAAVATRGIAPSFAGAAERYAALPWARLVEPAAAAARAYPMGAGAPGYPAFRAHRPSPARAGARRP